MKKVMIVGLGASGEACARFLLKRDYEVIATDTRENPPKLALLKDLPGFCFVPMSQAKEALYEAQALIMSPGISPFFSEAAPLVMQAQGAGIDVIGEIEVFARALAQLKAERGYDPKIIGITGTNGKTTTTVLTSLMCKAAGLLTCAAGNIGPNAVTELDKALEADQLPDVWVLELSSFQLQTTHTLQCDAATILNITQDHLDWHGGQEAYAAAKARIFADKTVRVLNRDDALTMAYAQGSWCSFGADEPERVNDWGLAVSDGLTWLTCQQDDSIRLSSRTTLENACTQLLMPQQALLIKGRHNAMNALAALALTQACGIDLSSCLRALSTYAGEAHRVQYVMSVKGVDYIDDSKGTNVGATVAALQGLGAEGKKMVVILGGDGKGQDFAPIAQAMSEYARAALTIGKDGEAIAQALAQSGIVVKKQETLEEAVITASQLAHEGDIVLLSPACASWDMFRDYAHRSQVFIDTVKQLAGEN